ncbi:MAG: hypothetical protein QOH73_1148 [Gaiellaceae bacterium]|jgi:hypothetical protein|nr:hypothetical protein [Gaiellaceae bacterium]
MFHLVSGLTAYDPITPRRVYDNPPVTVAAPRWTRLAKLASAVGVRGTHGRRQARTTSPAPACGTPSRG